MEENEQKGCPMRELERVPNFDTLSTQIERMVIEIVKKEQEELKLGKERLKMFKEAINGINFNNEEKKALTMIYEKIKDKKYNIERMQDIKNKIELQKKIIRTIKKRLKNFMLKTWLTNDYAVIDETRTFD